MVLELIPKGSNNFQIVSHVYEQNYIYDKR